MAKEMSIQARWLEKDSFSVETETGHQVLLGTGSDQAGPSPMEMLLVALAGCSGTGIISVLQKMRQQVTGYDIRVHGIRRQEHPQIFTSITVEHVFTGHHLRAEAIQRAIDLDTSTYCGVNIMLGASASIEHHFQIIEA